jgi:AraC-like DNA-binding protein
VLKVNEDVGANLRLFRELVTCVYELYSWVYDANMNLVYSNCPDEPVFNTVFSLMLKPDALKTENLKPDRPVVMTNSFGLMWLADFEPGNELSPIYVHILGPVFYDDIKMRLVENELEKLGLSSVLKRQCMTMFSKLPVIPSLRFFEYGQMLHCCLTGEKISPREFQYAATKELPTETEPETISKITHQGNWAATQTIMQFIEEGNLEYSKAMERMGTIGGVGKLSEGDPIRQMKNQAIALATLCVQAAVRGGLLPETAFGMGDYYILKFEACGEIAEFAEVNKSMLDDFVFRVHRAKSDSGISSEIRRCCDYIQLNIAEKIDLRTLSKLTGYSETYLSSKFSKEMGQTVFDYTAAVKIERAKLMLTDGGLSVLEIGERLGFSTPSYFGRQFRKLTGMTPSEYKNQIRGGSATTHGKDNHKL